MLFEWDEQKERKNISKHGIDFRTAVLVFADEKRIECFDYNHSYNEERYITIGMVRGVPLVLLVVYTERQEVIRIISARKATNKEKEAYYNG